MDEDKEILRHLIKFDKPVLSDELYQIIEDVGEECGLEPATEAEGKEIKLHEVEESLIPSIFGSRKSESHLHFELGNEEYRELKVEEHPKINVTSIPDMGDDFRIESPPFPTYPIDRDEFVEKMYGRLGIKDFKRERRNKGWVYSPQV